MQPTQNQDFTSDEAALAVALDLSKKSWKMALQDGKHDKPAIHTVDGEMALARLAHAVAVIKELKKNRFDARQMSGKPFCHRRRVALSS